jgi:hypothetical protein
MGKVSSLSIVDSGNYYTFNPSVLIGLPTADSGGATATLSLDSSVAGSITSINLTDSGNYYVSPVNAIISYDSSDSAGTYYNAIITRRTITTPCSVDSHGQITSVTIPNIISYGNDSISFDSATGTVYDFRATATATIDSALGFVNSVTLVYGGGGYDSAPSVDFISGRTTAFDSQYAIGDDITQTLSSGVKVKGEVQRYQLDSDGDSSRFLYLAHVGADDGEFRTFVNDLTINKINPSTSIGLKVTSVSEINTVSETEQNDIFTGNDVDDFLDFSEDNPFGDPEAQ